MNINFVAGISAFIGVIVGSFITFLVFLFSRNYEKNVRLRTRELEHKVKEIDTIHLLNSKVNEILHRHSVLLPDISSFDVFEDVHISIEDYAYLESFHVINNYYLPSYVLEQFFKDISSRRMVRSSQETLSMGGYTFKQGRAVLENFSEELTNMTNERKAQLKKIAHEPIHILRKDEYAIYD
ncbi:MAG: hypothetical protein LBV67_10745 [Streptococcaceae bacterium]|nr:hypothetical protein [Streptococcaceae bacterium]